MSIESKEINQIDLNETFKLTKTAVIEAGKIIMAYFKKTYRVEQKSADNPVTDADKAVDRFLKERLGFILPAAGWLSEETVDNFARLDRPQTWIVDPIDGTKEFVLGIPEFSISVALVTNDVPSFGIILNPATDELYAGINGGGVSLNDEPRQVSTRDQLDRIRVGASRSERKRGEFQPFENSVQIHTCGSIAYKLARVAAGQDDATWSRGPKNEWDICAGSLLVNEAGGKCVDLDGQPFRFNQKIPKVNGIIASNSDIFNEVVNLLRPLRHNARR